MGHTIEWIVAQAPMGRNRLAKEIDECTDANSLPGLRRLDGLVRGYAGIALTAADTQALNVVRTLYSSFSNLRFRRLNRPEVALGLIARILDPSRINQQALGICGPAAIVISAARSRKVDYVRFVCDLATTGAGNLGNYVRPHDAVLAFDPTGVLPPCDWIAMGSLRNDPGCLNAALNQDTYGGSDGSEVFDWLHRAGFSKVLLYNRHPWDTQVRCFPPHLVPTDPVPTVPQIIDLAIGLSERGWQLFMMAYMSLSQAISRIHQAMEANAAMVAVGVPHDLGAAVAAIEDGLLATEPPGRFGVVKSFVMGGGDGQHWTHVESIVRIGGGRLRVTVFNHGHRYADVEITEAAFARRIFGLVACTDVAA